jgi:transposase
MLQAIANLGGWLLMMGQHDRSESLFYYFRIEDQVPENHLLRFIDRYVSFDFVREKLRASIQRKRGDRRLIRKCCRGLA